MATGEFKGINERIMSISFLLVMPLMLGAIVYVIYLRSVNVVGSDTDVIFLVTPTTLGCIVLFLGIYEVLYGHEIERKPAYQIKRFLLYSSLSTLYFSFALGLWSAMQFYLLPFLYWRYSLILSFFVATMLLAVLILRIPKLRNLLSRLENGT